MREHGMASVLKKTCKVQRCCQESIPCFGNTLTSARLIENKSL